VDSLMNDSPDDAQSVLAPRPGSSSTGRPTLNHALQLLSRWVGPLALGALFFELFIRSFVYSPRPQIMHPILGQVPAPGSVWVDGREGLGHIHWSRQGVRGRDLPADEGKPSRRIIFLGDSFCVAEAVNDEQTYCARVEGELQRRLREPIWVGNCGRISLDAGDFLYYLPGYERQFHPDLIVITYNLSDFRVSNHRISGIIAEFDPAAPAGAGLVVHPTSEAKEHNLLDRRIPAPLRGVGHALIDGSSLALYGAARVYALGWKEAPDKKFITQDSQIASEEQMEKYLGSLAVLTHTPVVCAYIRPWSPIWGINNHLDDVTIRRLQQAAARVGIPLIDTGPDFIRYFRRTGQPANGFANTIDGPGTGHLNPAGHELVAHALAGPIARLLDARRARHTLRIAQTWARTAGVQAPLATCHQVSQWARQAQLTRPAASHQARKKDRPVGDEAWCRHERRLTSGAKA
jgi:hypothetical protein